MADSKSFALDWASIKDAGLFALALYGAALSTFNLWQARKRDSRQVKVSMSTIMLTYTNGSVGRPHVQVEAVNVGHRPVSVTMITLERFDGTRIFNTAPSHDVGLANTRLPVSLSDGERAIWLMSYYDLGDCLLRHGSGSKENVTPICEDSTGQVYRGKPWEIDPREFLAVV
jgi:hypothetical protein